MISFQTNRFAKGKIPCCVESIGKFDAACTEVDGICSSVVGGWSSLITMLVGMEIDQMGFGENAMDPGSAWDLWIFVGINAYQDCLVLVLPLVDELNEIVYKLCLRVRRTIDLLMKQSILLVIRVV